MYPLLRFAKEIAVHRSAPKLGLFDTHVGHHLCWPIDIDLWMELNNGRTLTLFDLGRVVLFLRNGIHAKMRAQGWVGTVAGSSVRYRRRVQMFDRLEMRSRLIGWDAKFLYSEQAMFRGGECTSHGLFRSAATDRKRMIPWRRPRAPWATATARPCPAGCAPGPRPTTPAPGRRCRISAFRAPADAV